MVPRRCTLDGFTCEVASADGVGLHELDAFTTLVVKTFNSLYRVVVLDPPGPASSFRAARSFPSPPKPVSPEQALAGVC